MNIYLIVIAIIWPSCAIACFATKDGRPLECAFVCTLGLLVVWLFR